MTSKPTLVLAAALLLSSSALNALRFPVVGGETKSAAGAGVLHSRGASSLFYNPANLIFSNGLETYGDLSYINVNYTYTHLDPAFDPVTAKIAGTPVALGGSYEFSAAPLVVGAVFVPTGTGDKTTLKGLPVQILSDYSKVDVEQSSSGYDFGVGAAYRLGQLMTLGASLILISESNTLKLSGDIAVDAKYQGSFYQYVLGGRGRMMKGRLHLGASYSLPVVKTYKGQVLSPLTNDAYEPMKKSGYVPGILAFSGQYHMGRFRPFAEVQYEMAAAGKSKVSQGIDKSEAPADLRNALHLIGGASLGFGRGRFLRGAFGYYQSTVGDGAQTLVDDTKEVQAQGMEMGNIDGITKMYFAGGYGWNLSKRFRMLGYGNYLTGRRVVPEGAPSEGTYDLSAMAFGVSACYGF